MLHDGAEWRAHIEIPPTFPENMPRLNLEVDPYHHTQCLCLLVEDVLDRILKLLRILTCGLFVAP